MAYRIPFLQYLRPKGRRQLQFYFLKDEDVFHKATEVLENTAHVRVTGGNDG